MKTPLPDEEYEREINELRSDPDVILSRTEQRMKYRQRQLLYSLRWHKKRGAELRAQGITVERLRQLSDAAEKEIAESEGEE